MVDKEIVYSAIVPFYNEEDSVLPLYNKLKKVLIDLGKHEIIFVDDGSTDKTFLRLRECAQIDKQVRIIKFRRNFGQSAALTSGFDHATGDIIITVDADLQNDPKDIPKLLEKLQEGYDTICGWRKHRKDRFLRKKVPSKVFNWFCRKISGQNIHDFGSTLRVYKRQVVKNISVYGELHRFIPVLVAWKGYKVSETEVKHHPRKYGKTKYGGGRLVRGLLDILTVYFLEKYLSRPMHLFGTLGILSIGLGTAIGAYLSILRILFNVPLSDRPLLLLAILMVVFGVQFLTLGLIGEMMTRNRYETGNKKPYDIEVLLNFKHALGSGTFERRKTVLENH